MRKSSQFAPTTQLIRKCVKRNMDQYFNTTSKAVVQCAYMGLIYYNSFKCPTCKYYTKDDAGKCMWDRCARVEVV